MEKLVMNEMLSMANIHVPDSTMAGGDMGNDDEMLYNQLLDQLGGKKKKRSGKKKSGKKKSGKKSKQSGGKKSKRSGKKKSGKKSKKSGGACSSGHAKNCGLKGGAKKSLKKSKKISKKSKKVSRNSKKNNSLKNKQFGGYIRYDDEFNLF